MRVSRSMLCLSVVLGGLVCGGTAEGSGHPADAGCDVRNSGVGIDGPFVWAGTDNPSQQTCSYRARQSAGYRAAGLWKVTVRRGQQSVEYSAGLSPACSVVGLIRSGDVVVVATQVAPGVGLQTGISAVRAGPTAHC